MIRKVKLITASHVKNINKRICEDVGNEHICYDLGKSKVLSTPHTIQASHRFNMVE